MKISLRSYVSVFLIAVLTFSMPFITLAQQGSVPAEAISAAEKDAEASVNKPLWFGVGCLLTGLGTIIAYVRAPSPPANRLMGKSPEYVALYTQAYQSKAKSIQGRSALIGCAVSAVVYVAAAIYGGANSLP